MPPEQFISFCLSFLGERVSIYLIKMENLKSIPLKIKKKKKSFLKPIQFECIQQFLPENSSTGNFFTSST